MFGNGEYVTPLLLAIGAAFLLWTIGTALIFAV